MTANTLAPAPKASPRQTAPILVGFDGSPDSLLALEWALDVAERRPAPVTICHVVARTRPDGLQGDLVLADAEAHVLRRPSTAAVTYLPLVGHQTEQLVEASSAAQLLVVGARGHSALGALLLGSVSEQVARDAPCPVIVVRGSNSQHSVRHRRRIVVGVDGSADSAAAVAFAFDEAARRHLPVHAVHAFDANAVLSMAYLTEDTLNGLRESEATELVKLLTPQSDAHPEVEVTFEVMQGSPASTLAGAASGAELLVIGSHGHSKLAARLLGSTSHTVLHHAPCPVAIVRGQPDHATSRGSRK
jgi:nucleotide-binding universal stress UspA family protein